MRVGVQFIGALGPNQTKRWFTYGWPQTWHVIWDPAPVTPKSGAPELQWNVEVERSDSNNITYWLTVTNLTGVPVNFEGRYAVLN